MLRACIARYNHSAERFRSPLSSFVPVCAGAAQPFHQPRKESTRRFGRGSSINCVCVSNRQSSVPLSLSLSLSLFLACLSYSLTGKTASEWARSRARRGRREKKNEKPRIRSRFKFASILSLVTAMDSYVGAQRQGP